MIQGQLDPKVLGQLLLMQSLMNNLPDKNSILSFVCKGLLDIPGISKAEYFDDYLEKDSLPFQVNYPIGVDDSKYGHLILSVSDYNLYSPYEDYLNNFIFMIGIILEERNQRLMNKQHQRLLEQRIIERTRELILEKENLIESQRRFSDLMRNVKLLSVMLDIDGNIIFCNEYLLKITKYTSDEILGKNWFDIFIDKQIVVQIKHNFFSVIKGSEFSHNYENEIINKEGERLLISWNNTILHDADRNISGTASIGENITVRKKAEEALINKNKEYQILNDEYSSLNQELTKSFENLKNTNIQLEIAKEKAEESDRLKTAFLQNMSHEIRTPMNAIMGFSSLLHKYFDNKNKLEKYSEIINQRCNDLLDIINDILDIAKIESGQLSVNYEELNMNDLITELLNFFIEYRKRLDKKHIDFRLSIDSSPENCKIFTDKVKLKQILINLLNNSLKFTEKGFVNGKCSFHDHNMMFTITDTGVGIPADKQKFIFERFTQLNNSRLKNSGGTGLGLSIVKGLVDLLGGKLSLKSEPEKGTTFTFTIPYKPA